MAVCHFYHPTTERKVCKMRKSNTAQVNNVDFILLNKILKYNDAAPPHKNLVVIYKIHQLIYVYVQVYINTERYYI